MNLIKECAPGSVKETSMKAYFGRKVAIDASMCLYQFLIAVRQDGQNLANEDGEITSHLNGIFYRTMRMLDAGIKPLYVFDGKPPEMKQSNELKKRAERRQDAAEELRQAQEEDNQEEIDKLQRRLVRVTKEQNQEVQKLLTLMGIPWIEAVCEAEATCAELAKKGLVYGVGTEDMDALTFGATKLIRNLTVSEARKLPVFEIDFKKLLEELQMTHEEFVDLCIMLGCDYTTTIRGIGPKTSVELISKHRSIEKVLENIDTKKHPIPEDFRPDAAADLFLNAEVTDVTDLVFDWKKPDEEGLVQFLVTEKGFNLERVQNGITRLLNARKHMTQQRLENWFTVTKSDSTVKNPAKIAAEKKAAEELAAKKATKRKAPGQPAAVKKARK